MTEKSRMENAEEFIDNFADNIKELIKWYDKGILNYGKKYNEMISFVALSVLSYGKNNQISFTPEQTKAFKGNKFHLNSNTEEDGSMTVTVIYDDEEETSNAESDSGEDIQAEV